MMSRGIRNKSQKNLMFLEVHKIYNINVVITVG